MPATKKKSAKKPAKKPAPQPEDRTVTDSALKLVDEAASLLRKGISAGSDSGEQIRLEAKRKARTVLDKTSSSLTDLLDESASILRRITKQID